MRQTRAAYVVTQLTQVDLRADPCKRRRRIEREWEQEAKLTGMKCHGPIPEEGSST
jgi:hypothetical protein